MKLILPLEQGMWHGCGTETVWAERLSGNRYRIRNSPFFAFGVSAEDVVFAEFDDDERPILKGVSLRGGHSTYRIMRSEHAGSAAFTAAWEPMAEVGCSFEEGPSRLLAVDVPPKADIFEVYRMLENGEAAGAWQFEEGHCGHSLLGQSRG